MADIGLTWKSPTCCPEQVQMEKSSQPYVPPGMSKLSCSLDRLKRLTLNTTVFRPHKSQDYIYLLSVIFTS